MDFIEKVNGFLLEPSKTFGALKEEPLEEALKDYAVIAVIYFYTVQRSAGEVGW